MLVVIEVDKFWRAVAQRGGDTAWILRDSWLPSKSGVAAALYHRTPKPCATAALCSSSIPLSMVIQMRLSFWCLLLVGIVFRCVVAAEPCRIEIVEKGTGWPVPLVE